MAGRVAFSYQQSDFVRPISEPPPGIADLALTDQELAMYLDLGPYVNPSYYVVQVRDLRGAVQGSTRQYRAVQGRTLEVYYTGRQFKVWADPEQVVQTVLKVSNCAGRYRPGQAAAVQDDVVVPVGGS
jgi:hypothetical protein